MVVICSNGNCKFNASNFCKKDTVFLEAVGVCNEWVDRNGQVRQVPLYDVQGKPVATPYQKPDLEEKIEGIKENEESEGKAEENASDVVKNGE